jgi:hypothetical protein
MLSEGGFCATITFGSVVNQNDYYIFRLNYGQCIETTTGKFSMKLTRLVNDSTPLWNPVSKETIRVTFDLYRCPPVNTDNAGTDGDGFTTGTVAPSEGDIIIGDGNGGTQTVSGLKYTSSGLELETTSVTLTTKSTDFDTTKSTVVQTFDYDDFSSIHFDYVIFDNNNSSYAIAGHGFIVGLGDDFRYFDASTDIGSRDNSWDFPWDGHDTQPRITIAEKTSQPEGINVQLTVGGSSTFLQNGGYTIKISFRIL